MDERDFDEFYTASAPRITSQVYAMVGDRDTAQECVQQAFVRVWERRHSFDDVLHREAWVRTTAYRLAVDRWRRATRARREPDRAVQPRGIVEGPDGSAVDLWGALRLLPANHRRAVVLHHLADLPVRDVARELGVPENTVKTWLRRGREALRPLLAESTGDDATVVTADA